MNSPFNMNSDSNNNNDFNNNSSNNNTSNSIVDDEKDKNRRLENEQKRLDQELNFIAFYWLSRNSSLKTPILSTLYTDLNRNNLLPKCHGWTGNIRDYTFNELKSKYKYIQPDYMKQVFNHCTELNNKHGHLSDLDFKFNTYLGDANYSMIPPTVNNNTIESSNTLKLHPNNNNSKKPTNVYKSYPILLPPQPPDLDNNQLQIIQPTQDNNNNNNINDNSNIIIINDENSPSHINTNTNITTTTNTTITCTGNNTNIKKPIIKSFKHQFSELIQININENGFENRLDLKLISREFYRRKKGSLKMIDLPMDIYRDYKNTLIVLGHKAPTYCFSFDKSGRTFITASDDHLIKIWLTCTGRLLHTLRGHFGDITDMSINLDNSILASASNDNVIRIWNLTTCEPTRVLQSHDQSELNEITSVTFCPNPLNKHLLLSSDKFGELRLWNLNQIEQTIILLKTREITAILGASFNKGGTLIIASVGNTIMIWSMLFHPPKLVNTLEGHTTPINAIQFSHSSDAIVSGSLDGNVIVWRHLYGTTWNHILFKTANNSKTSLQNPRNRKKTNSNINISNSTFKNVIWSLTDKYIITSNDNVVAVWNSTSGELHLEMTEHKKDVYVLSCHPHDERLIMSSGYDAQVILWNIETGELIKKFTLEEPTENFPILNDYSISDILDGSFSPDGTRFAVTNALGKWFMFELGNGNSKEFYKDVPNEQYFFTDYHPLIKDSFGYVLDEITQQPPHLLPKQLLVNFHGNAYQQQPLITDTRKYYLEPEFKDTKDYQRVLERQLEFERKEILAFNKGIPEDQKDMEANPIVVHIPQIPPAKPKPKPKPKKKPAAASAPVIPISFTQPSLMDLLAYEDDNNISDPSDLDYEESSESSSSSSGTSNNNSDNEDKKDNRRYNEKRKDKMMIDDGEIDDNSDSSTTSSVRSYSSDLPKSRSKKKIKEKRKRNSKSKLLTRSNTSSSKLKKMYNGLSLPDENNSDEDDTDYFENNSTFNYNDDMDIDIDDQLLGLVTKKETRGRKKKQISNINTNNNNNNNNKIGNKIGNKKLKISNKTTTSNISTTTNNNQNTDIPSEILCPKWISTTSISIYDSYYSPQIGDTVYYFYQGHQKYIEQFSLDRNNQQQLLMPNHLNIVNSSNGLQHQFPYLKSMQECLVKKLDYYISGQGIHRAEITLMNTESGETFICSYHVSDIPDFLVLASKVKYSLTLGWKQSMRFRMYYPDEEAWYTGTILEISSSNSLYPDSLWERLKVIWDGNEDEERLSFWEIVQLDDHEFVVDTQDNNVSNDLSEISFKILKEKVLNTINYIEVIDSLEKNIIIQKLKDYMRKKITQLYREPVDLNIYPLYIRFVPHPMDINTMLSRLENDYYRRLESVYFDGYLIMKNAFIYNKANTMIAKNSKLVFKNFLKILNESNYSPFTILDLPTMNDLNQIIKENNEEDDQDDQDNDVNEDEDDSDYNSEVEQEKKLVRNKRKLPTTATTTTTTTSKKNSKKKKKKKKDDSSGSEEDYKDSDLSEEEEVVYNNDDNDEMDDEEEEQEQEEEEGSDYSDNSSRNAHKKKKLKTTSYTKHATKVKRKLNGRGESLNNNNDPIDVENDNNNVQKTNRQRKSIVYSDEEFDDEEDEDNEDGDSEDDGRMYPKRKSTRKILNISSDNDTL